MLDFFNSNGEALTAQGKKWIKLHRSHHVDTLTFYVVCEVGAALPAPCFLVAQSEDEAETDHACRLYPELDPVAARAAHAAAKAKYAADLAAAALRKGP